MRIPIAVVKVVTLTVVTLTAVTLMATPLAAQAPKSAGIVTASTAEFKIPLPSPANDVWIWNRADTPDNAGEYSWVVTAKNGAAQYSFGFYLYKFPGSRETRGRIQDLLKTGQASVFKEDADGRGELVPNAKVAVTVENAAIVIRITDAALVRLIFRDRPETTAIHSRTPDADFETVRVTYRD